GDGVEAAAEEPIRAAGRVGETAGRSQHDIAALAPGLDQRLDAQRVVIGWGWALGELRVAGDLGAAIEPMNAAVWRCFLVAGADALDELAEAGGLGGCKEGVIGVGVGELEQLPIPADDAHRGAYAVAPFAEPAPYRFCAGACDLVLLPFTLGRFAAVRPNRKNGQAGGVGAKRVLETDGAGGGG